MTRSIIIYNKSKHKTNGNKILNSAEPEVEKRKRFSEKLSIVLTMMQTGITKVFSYWYIDL